MVNSYKNIKDRKIDFKHNLRIYSSFVKKYKILAIVLLFITLIIEASYVIEKFIFKIIVDKGTDFTSNALPQQAFVKILLFLAALFGLMVLIRTISKWFNFYLINLLEVNMIKDLKIKFFNHLIHLDYEFHTTHRTGSLISRLIRGGSAIEKISDFFIFNFVPLLIQLIIVIISLIKFDLVSSAVIFVTVIFFIAYTLYINRIQEPSRIRSNNAEDFEKASVSDIFTNIESIK